MPRRPIDPVDDLTTLRLGPHCFAHLRAVAEGVPVSEAAKRYLAVEHGHQAPVAHRLLVERVRSVARRAGDGRWRLVGLRLQDVGSDQPSLDDWAAAEGLDDWSHADQLQRYQECFGAGEPGERRRRARNARLRQRQLQLLRELEATAAEPASPLDLVDGWFAPEISAHLLRLGVLRLSDLQERIARGGRWWVGLPGYGPVKASRLASYLALLLPAAPTSGWPVALVGECLARYNGEQGLNRVSGGFAGTDAHNDHQAVQAWMAARATSPATQKAYAKEAERFILWCVLERSKALSDVGADDCRAYMDFLANVPNRWISRDNTHRMAPGWAPFKGQLSLASQKQALAALHSLFSWLVQARYLGSNPWVLVNRKLGDDPRGQGDDTGSRAFTPAAWRALMDHLGQAEDSPSRRRLQWLCVFASTTGLRAAELLAAQVGHLQPTPAGWVLRVHGKGRKNRTVPVPTSAMTATRAYLASRGLELERADEAIPLLASLTGEGGISYRSLHETFARLVKKAFAGLPESERRRAEKSSAHWLRHTHATRAAEQGVPPDVLQENLGQSDPRTTARYYRAQLERRQKAMEKAFE